MEKLYLRRNAMKKNIFVENYLLTGGIITGIFTFMGAIPLAITSAVITGGLIGKAVKKEQQREAIKVYHEQNRAIEFQRDCTWEDIDKILKALQYFSPTFPLFIKQEKLENLFKTCTYITPPYPEKVIPGYAIEKRKLVNVDEIIKLATETDDSCKFVATWVKDYENSYKDYPFIDYIVVKDDIFYMCKYDQFFPNRFRERCEKLGIEFKAYINAPEEYKELRKNIYNKHYNHI